MPYSPATYEEKPYNRCIDCVHIGKNCDGPDFLAMTTARLCEWARLRKAFLNSQDRKWTNAYIAEQSDVSRTTVDRFLAGDIEDLRFTTASRIIKVLINGTWGQYPCAMAALDGEGAETAAECKRLQEAYESEHRKVEYLKEQVQFKESQMLEKDRQLAERDIHMRERADFMHRKDSLNILLGTLLGICVIVIMVALAVDAANPNIGFFWLQ